MTEYNPATQFFIDISTDGYGEFGSYYCQGPAQDDSLFPICLWFANIGMPIPKIFNPDTDGDTIMDKYNYLEFWSAIFEFRPF